MKIARHKQGLCRRTRCPLSRGNRVLVSSVVLAAAVLAISLLGCRHGVPGLGKGIEYRAIVRTEVPLSAHVLEVRRGRKDLAFSASVGEAIRGKETVPAMVKSIPVSLGHPVAAVNGDYFEFRTEPRFFGTLEGLCIANGELLSGPAGSAFCVDRAGTPSIRKVRARFEVTWPDGSTGRFGLNCSTADYESEVHSARVVLFTPRFGRSTRTKDVREFVLSHSGEGPWLPLQAEREYRVTVRAVETGGNTELAPGTMVLSVSAKTDESIPVIRVGDTLTLRTAFSEDISDVMTAVAGGPPLLRASSILPKQTETPRPRAPRTAVGFNKKSTFLVVVDGRQEKLSRGMNHRELAEFMRELGCTEALNLDGGGSSTFWLNGQILNSPSDGRPRAVGNCLVLLRRERGAAFSGGRNVRGKGTE